MKKLLFFVLVVVLAITARKKDDPEPIMAQEVILDKTTLTLEVGDSGLLRATVLPTNADDKTIRWVSSNSDVVRLDHLTGMFTALMPGTCTIRAATNGVFAECEITVTYKTVVGGGYGYLNWKLLQDGTFIVSGEGAMPSREWEDYILQIKRVIINDGVISIGDYAFHNCVNLSDIIISNSVTNIGKYAFYGTSLAGVTIPNSVTNIGEYTFSHCYDLTRLTISAANIGEGAFGNCESLANIIISDGVTNIGEYAFFGCRGLTDVTISNSVTNIGDHAFENCGILSDIIIPNSVTNIGDYAFSNCNLSDVIIHEGVKYIGEYAFYGLNISSLTIPNSVTSIGLNAFSGWNLTSVIIMATIPPMIGVENFLCDDDTLYVPKGCVDLYKADAAWNSAFTTITEQP